MSAAHNAQPNLGRLFVIDLAYDPNEAPPSEELTARVAALKDPLLVSTSTYWDPRGPAGRAHLVAVVESDGYATLTDDEYEFWAGAGEHPPLSDEDLEAMMRDTEEHWTSVDPDLADEYIDANVESDGG